jgi:DNA-binding transcriptional LysR family regulator
LTALERSLGVQLLTRTTRQSRPTEAGLNFYRRIKPALIEIDTARREVAGRAGEPSGLLRIAAPPLFAAAYLAPVVSEFLQRHPAVEIELRTSDRPADVLEDGLDLAIRIRELPDSSLKSRRLGSLRVVVVGSPGYLRKFGTPEHPDNLSNHQCVVRLGDAETTLWRFRVDSRRKSIRVAGRFRTDDTSAAQQVAVRGFALCRVPLWQIRSLVDAGTLQIVLEKFEMEKLPIFAVLPPSQTTPVTSRRFVDLLMTRIKKERW